MKAVQAFVVVAALVAFQLGCTIILDPGEQPARDAGSGDVQPEDGDRPADGDGDADGDADGDSDGDADVDSDADGDCAYLGPEVEGNCVDEDCDGHMAMREGTELFFGPPSPEVNYEVNVRVQSVDCAVCVGMFCELQDGGGSTMSILDWRTEHGVSPCLWATETNFPTAGTWHCRFCENCDTGPECISGVQADLSCSVVVVRAVAAE